MTPPDERNKYEIDVTVAISVQIISRDLYGKITLLLRTLTANAR